MSVRELVSQAAGEADALNAEGARIMAICNSCRYCEGYCAVFPAMERRGLFDPATLAYLSNLCHHCGACLYACQYAPPHEFAVNVPRTFAQLRLQSYERFAWPRPFAAAYRRNGAVVAVLLAIGLGAFLALAIALNGAGSLFTARSGVGSFYAVFPHGLMVAIFGTAFAFAVLALAIGALRFRAAIQTGDGPRVPDGGIRGLSPVLTLSNLEGGGEGCYVRAGFDDPPTPWRRRFHHFTFYGFLLCFASTSLATIYHYAFGWQAPYAWSSPVVVLGTLGGIGLVVGPAGLLWLGGRHDRDALDTKQRAMDVGFILLLLLTSVTGLALLALRDTSAMPLLLAVHLGVVLALFLTLPYGKFVHGIYRSFALLHDERERSAPPPGPQPME